MKKTLFLTALLSLSTPTFAATDCLMPQTIINVNAGTATQSDTGAVANVTISTKNTEDGSKTVS